MAAAPDSIAILLDHRRAGRLQECVEAGEELLAAGPDTAEVWRILATAYEDLDQPVETERCLRHLLARDPADPSLHHALARTLAGQRKLDAAEAACRQALEFAPDEAHVHVTLGKILHRLGRESEAETAFRDAVRLQPRTADAYRALGIFLADRGRTVEGLASLEDALQIEPRDAATHRDAGFLLAQLGQLREAEKAFREAVHFEPRWPKAYAALALVKQFEPEDDDLSAMEKLAEDSIQLADEERMVLHFALAKAYDDIGETSRAFECLESANRLARLGSAYDVAAEEEGVERLMKVFDRDLFERFSGSGYASRTPIFIVGMPRSGTTLVEQILGSHPEVAAAGELDELYRVAGAIRIMNADRAGFPEGSTGLALSDLEQLGRLYVTRLGRVAPDASYVTDKMPANFHYLGLIHLILPNARIVHCRRDPVDTCLSCYATDFENMSWTHDLEDIGRYYCAYSRLLEHWERTLPAGRVLDVRYEDVVGDLEREARRMVAHCGLAWHDSCLDFTSAARPVQTASLVQVRKPVYATSVGRWRRYERQLAPLLAVLSRCGADVPEDEQAT